ncbi:hypothetical protein SAMN02745117_00777 [Lampropedia hyalina DSM 16112]|uniref:Antitoxin n=1 Tax=Lampropedia hyalina DSM 16112 TaxID=1122156 RepID=A0A1M4W0Q7_9BURK|nr:DUF6364 family protein [Lampropedia hyalina]SHE74725.1 hypothetical protein SAMN02745117_00777 [Lampropedia hyalina DSM 16112]
MQTKLTLRLEAGLIEQAKAQARQKGKSLSQLVADYFVQLEHPPAQPPLPPLVTSLKGALKNTQGKLPDEEDYRAYLQAKHQ